MAERPQARSSHLRVTRGDEGTLLVYDVKADTGHVLNPTAARVFELADGKRTTQEIAKWLDEYTNVPPDEQVVWYALQELEEAGLLEGSPAKGARPKISRRAVMARVAVGAAAVALLPRLDSIKGLSQVARHAPRLDPSTAHAQGYGYVPPSVPPLAAADVGVSVGPVDVDLDADVPRLPLL